MAGDSTKRRCQRHGLAKRRDILAARVANLECRLAIDDVRVVFGGRRLALAGNNPLAHSCKSRDDWRGRWDRARSGVILVKGDTEATYGNVYAKIILAAQPAEKDRLLFHVPNVVNSSSVRLHDLAGGDEWVEIELSDFSDS